MRYAGLEFSLEEFYANDVLDIYGASAQSMMAQPSLVVTSGGEGKQMPPKYMGDKPQLKKSNK